MLKFDDDLQTIRRLRFDQFIRSQDNLTVTDSDFSVSGVGDVNGDGYADLIIGARYADPHGSAAGESYVVFGREDGFGAELDLSGLEASNGGDGTAGFVINGTAQGDLSGFSVSGAGDVNGDGYADPIIGAYSANSHAGANYALSDRATLGALHFTSLASASFAENGSGVVRNIEAALNDGAADVGISYSITGGDDRALFTIDAASGELSFIDAPDFETPQDADGDNIYEVTVTATEGGASESQYLTVTVTDVKAEQAAFITSIPSLDLSGLDGSRGFVINGIDAFDRSGWSVSGAGDVNGDGYADLIIGADRADPGDNGAAGESYVIFGRAGGFDAALDLSSLATGDGSRGFVINGIDAFDRSGWSVSGAGDVNGDGYADLIIGAPVADPHGTDSGESYVVFGKASGFGSTLDLSTLDGTVGFVINGIDANDQSGRSVSAAEDVNGDGYDDLIIGAPSADPHGSDSGESYVIFGRAGGFDAALDLSSLDGESGFVINGIDAFDRSGWSVSGAGDVNGDGFADLIIGAGYADGRAGESYVVFGKEGGFDAALDLSSLDGSSGFVINGIDANDRSGFSVSGAGDVNGDGYADLIIGAGYADPHGSNSGESYVVFGKEGGFDAALDLSSLDGSSGFVINGSSAGDRSGFSVSAAGDVNGDGYDDLIIGAHGADPGGDSSSGESYVVFGKASGFDAALDLSSLDGRAGFVINGIKADDESGFSVSAAGDVNGDGFADLIIGAHGADGGAGESYVIFGGATLGALHFTSLASASFAENGSGVVRNIEAALNDGAADVGISYSITGGDDRALFTIDAASGELSFIDAPDFETPQDADGDNIYEVTVTATEGGASESQYLTVTVTDVKAEQAAFITSIPSLDLSGLDGSRGFVINGIDAFDRSGWSVSGAGDVNGDGYADLIIGADRADPGDNGAAGESYVIFGRAGGFDAALDLSSLATGDGSRGFVINGIDAFDRSGWSVSGAGDVNGDGYADLIIGAPVADPHGTDSGESYVVFGKASGFGSTLDLSTLDGTVGFVINGIDANDQSGRSVSAAEDVNGDGYDDLIIGAPSADPHGSDSGESYVIFGRAGGFDAALDLSSLDGESGFVINGIDAFDRSGWSVSGAGDVNGDGFADLIIGAGYADGRAGESYVVFGKEGGFDAALDLSSLDGSSGFVINGIDANDRSGFSVSGAGDVNGDGYADLIIGAGYADPHGSNSGESYVVFGKEGGFDAALDLSSLDGSSGFVINGSSAGDRSGFSVSAAGDVNGDGYNDLIIGAGYADPHGSNSGESYVVFGKEGGFDAALDLSSLDGRAGFVINGIKADDESGFSVSAAGDVNGDGYDDLIIGAHGADGGAGESYVIFGGATLGAPHFTSLASASFAENGSGVVRNIEAALNDGAADVGISYSITGGDDRALFTIDAASGELSFIAAPDFEAPQDADGDNVYEVTVTATGGTETVSQDLTVTVTDVKAEQAAFTASIPSLDLSSLAAGDGTGGFVINGIDAGDESGFSVSGAGDVNGDGFADLIIGAGYADGRAGESYVIFGRAGGFDAAFDLSNLDGSAGFVINGIDRGDRSGVSVSGAGDVNGDGYADLIIGAYRADPHGSNSGESYVVFGKEGGFDAALDLSSLDGSSGFVINGIDANDYSGVSVSGAGDVNGDGFADLVIGASRADPGDNGAAGESYVIFGRAGGFDAALDLSSLAAGDGESGFVISGIDMFDQSSRSVSGAGDVNGDGYADLIIGARYADPGGDSSSGESYVVFGKEGGFGAELDLSSLDGSSGFVINGIDTFDQSGFSVSGAGDVNGDGYADLIIGARYADPGGDSSSGESYVVFGKASGFDAALDLSSLDGSSGFVINGIDTFDQSGFSVSGAGDVNGDGYADLIIGARYADPGGDSSSGESYVVFGKASGFDAALDLSSLDGTTGFVINGIDAGDESGVSVSGAGDVNGDGFADLIIGAHGADGGAGASYVIFGGATLEALHFTSLASAGFAENGSGVVRNIDASLKGGAADVGISYSITGGADRALFTLDAASGELSFIDAPDFETPQDADGDNVYEVTVTATEDGASESQDMTITVTDVKAEQAAFITSIPSLDLSSLATGGGSRGFVINGIAAGDESGVSVSGAGDVNGDGFADLIIGANRADDPNGNSNSGESYVVFGKVGGFDAELDLSSLNGTTGFVINGIDTFDQSGRSVSGAGDVNGDGFADLIIGAQNADPGGDSSSGESYVVFGKVGGFDAELDLSSLNGTTGFVINGIDAFDQSGFSVSGAGDVNGDGYADLIIGAVLASGFTGASYVVFGKEGGFDAALNLSGLEASNGGDGTAGFVINGIAVADQNGFSVSGAGDVNGDGYADLIIGARGADGDAGESYVVFGKARGFDAELDLSSLDGTTGFVINGIDAFDQSGFSVSGAGDVNGDGYADLIIGARGADGGAGESYVIFGREGGFDAALDLSSLDGTAGFVINGIDADDLSGASVSGAGDVNGDGYDDLIIGAHGADGGAGESYVIFGREGGFDAALDLSSLDGTAGFVINGINGNDYSGQSVSGAGDVNGDGFADLIIGANRANGDAGESYVIFGGATLGAPHFTSLASASFAENGSGVVRNIDATLKDGAADVGISYSVTGGDDRALFTIDAASGELSFIAAPDFEAPQDADGDNVYEVTVTATGGTETVSQDLTVTVTDDAVERTAFITSIPSLDLSSLAAGDGSSGFVINGSAAFDQSGFSVSGAGDVNGDGFADLIIGATDADPGGDSRAGESYVVFGKEGGFTATLDLSSLDGTTGFVINGIDAFDRSGWSVSGAGDVNGDGYADLIIGATDADPGGDSRAGESYVVFGRAGGFDAALDLSTLDGRAGFVINGIDADDESGRSVSAAGDFNGDGYADLIIGASRADPGDNGAAGESYVIFGRAGGFDAALDLSSLAAGDGESGFVINGIDTFDQSGSSVSGAGDVNGDGYADLIIGARYADPHGSASGESYVVFGKASGFDAALDLSSLDGRAGFVINGIDAGDRSGFSVSGAGDVNGDGYADLIIGARYADPHGSASGESYVVFGKEGGFDAALDLSSLAAGDGSSGFVINGIDAGDQSGFSVSGAGDVNGDGYADLIIGARYADPHGSNSGESYVIFGGATLGAALDLSSLDGTAGFVINGIDAGDESGASVSAAGDVNGDGYDDLIIGARFADGGTGESYVIFGGATLGSLRFLSSASAGFAENGSGVVRNIDASLKDGAADVGITYSITGGADRALFTIDATSGELSFIDAPDFETQQDVDGDNVYEVTVTATGGTETVSQDLTVTVTNVNDAPTTSGLSVSTSEDTAYSFTAADFSFADVDGDTLQAVRIDVLPATGSLTLDGAAVTAGQVIPAAGIGTLVYTPAANASGTVTFGYSVSDGTAYSAGAEASVSVTAVNDAPVLILSETPRVFNEGDAPLVIDPGLTLTDVDSNTLKQTVIGFVDGFTAGDRLGFVNDGTTMGDIAIRLDDEAGGTLVLQSAAGATPAQWQAALQAVTFHTISDSPGTEPRTFFFIVTDDNSTSVQAETALTVTPVNDAPTTSGLSVSTPADTAYSFTAADFSFADVDGDTLQAVRVDVLPASGQLTLNGTVVTVGQAISVDTLATLVYTPAANASGTVTFGYSVSDGTAYSAGAEATVILNGAPTTSGLSVSTDRDTAYSFTAADFSFADVDGDTLQAVRIDVLPATGSLTLDGAAVTAGQVIPAAGIGTLVYTPAANASGTVTFGYSVSDGTAYSAGAEASVSVNAYKGPLVLGGTFASEIITDEDKDAILDLRALTFKDSSDGGALDLTTLPDSKQPVLTLTLTASGIGTLEAQARTGITIANNGTDALILSGNAIDLDIYLEASPIRFQPAADQNGSATLSLTLTDAVGANGSVSLDLTLIVNAQNDAPTTSGLSVSTSEDTAYSFTAADFSFADVDGDTLQAVRIDVLPATGSLTLDGAAVTAGQVIPAAGIGTLVYTPAANASGTVTFGYSVSDGTAYSAGAEASVSVTAVNDAPVLILSETPRVFNEGDAPLVIDPGLTLTDVDSNTLKQTVIGFVDGFTAGDRLGFVNDGTTMGDIAIRLDDEAGGTLVLQSAAGATPAQWQAALQAVTFHTISDSPGTEPRTFFFIVTDDNSTSVQAETALTVTPVNDAPTTSGLSVSTPADTAYSFTAADFSFADVDGDTLQAVRVDVLPASGQLTLNGTVVTVGQAISVDTLATLVYTPAANASGTVTFGYSVSDGTAYSAGAEATVILNGAPTTSGLSVSTDRDTAYSFTAADFSFADVDGDTLQAVRIDVLPATGSLTLDGAAVTAGQVIPAAGIGTLVYTPAANASGTVTFGYSVSDGTAYSAGAEASVSVNAYKGPLVLGGTFASEIITDEDKDAILDLRALTFKDSSDGGALDLTTLPDSKQPVLTLTLTASGIGTLEAQARTGITIANNGTDALILSGNAIDLDIYLEASPIRFQPAADQNGSATLSLTLTDAVGANGSVSLDLTLIVNAQNDAPTTSGLSVSTSEDTAYSFTAADFSFADVDGDTLQAVRIDVLPATGSLTLDGAAVTAGQVIPAAGIGTLVYTPAANASGTVTFGYSVSDGTAYSAGAEASVSVTAVSEQGGRGGSIPYTGGGAGISMDAPIGRTTSDPITRGSGNDAILGDAGDDVMLGGAGADHFVFRPQMDNNAVAGFNVREDVLDIQFATSAFKDIADLRAASTNTTVGGIDGLSIDFENDDTDFLQNLDLEYLSSITVIFINDLEI